MIRTPSGFSRFRYAEQDRPASGRSRVRRKLSASAAVGKPRAKSKSRP
ncbi:MAG TPA: hypothetical protein VFP44_04145 [Usitatibacter sp.]|nr:hypothetical protein [Usitatibacter sp.]